MCPAPLRPADNPGIVTKLYRLTLRHGTSPASSGRLTGSVAWAQQTDPYGRIITNGGSVLDTIEGRPGSRCQLWVVYAFRATRVAENLSERCSVTVLKPLELSQEARSQRVYTRPSSVSRSMRTPVMSAWEA